ncbi:hypothetical protein LMG24076_04841 [Trinickia soli]|nr:hypothetical protein LMG24076_04841 [Trinickia soli]
MAYISQRGEYWRAEVRRRGYKPVYRTFDTKLRISDERDRPFRDGDRRFR